MTTRHRMWWSELRGLDRPSAALHWRVRDEPVRADQYRLVVRRAWSLCTVDGRIRAWQVLRESLSEEWVPATAEREWVFRFRYTGERRWLRGSDRGAVRHGFGESFRDEPPVQLRARFGDFGAAEAGREPESADGRIGCWQTPTPEFLATLPRDPRQLLDRLRADSPKHAPSTLQRLGRRPRYIGPWVYATDALSSGLVPADLRAALYRAMQLLPGAHVAEDTSTRDVASVVGLVLDRSPIRDEVFLDPDTGNYAGKRRTVTAWNPQFAVRPGTVIGESAVRTTIVDRCP